MKPRIYTIALMAGTLLSVNVAFGGPHVYIPLGEADKIQVVNTTSLQIVDVIENVGNAHGLAVTPDGRWLIAGSLSEEPDASPGTPPKPASVSEADHDAHHRVSEDATPSGAGNSVVTIIDTKEREIVRRITVAGAVHHVAVSPDSRWVVTTHPGINRISVIDLETFKVVTSAPSGLAPNYAAFAPDGNSVYVSNTGEHTISELSTRDWRVVRQLPAGQAPEHLVVSKDGLSLFVNNVAPGTVTVLSLSDGQIRQRIPVGAQPHGIDLSDDGQVLYASSKEGNTLTAIALDSGERRELALSPAPYHVTAIQGSNQLYVTSRAEKLVWIVDQISLKIIKPISLAGIGHQMAVGGR